MESEFYNAGSPATFKRYRYRFEASSYDALNRLKSADYSHYNGSWLTTSAYDLANIGYDAAGNIRTLQRFNQNAVLIDNLTYNYPGSSNRLSSVADAITTTSEPWDAESGSFTYDANGNMKTAPAPYSVTAVTYDHQNLPLSLTRSGTTTTYRYNEAGQRITKQVGSGSTEVYLLQGALTLAVYTVPASGTPSSWYFNVLAGEKVVGRQPNTGSRSYYHTDLLGSTRSVVQGTTVVESYDFEPWGLLMPGRTLAGATKEGFTGKERDSETGLDYFGARYYMAALGRFAAVDPQTAKFPEWSAYTYTLNNPLGLVDPDGECPIPFRNCFGRQGLDLAAGLTPGVSTGVDATTALTGRNPVTGERVGFWGRTVAVAGVLTPFSGGQIRAVGRTGKAARQAARHGDEVADATRVATKMGDDAAGGAKEFSDSDLVARGGANITPESIVEGTATHPSAGVRGFSAQAKPGADLCELCTYVPNNQVGVTTVGDVRRAGGDVVSTPGRGNHETVTRLDPNDASRILSPSQPNPVPPHLRRR